jgi:hypothetical protein
MASGGTSRSGRRPHLTLRRAGGATDTFGGKTAWQGVHVFELEGHPMATRAYAWSSPIGASTKRRFFAVLHTDKINSPFEAVRAAIVQELRETRR